MICCFQPESDYYNKIYSFLKPGINLQVPKTFFFTLEDANEFWIICPSYHNNVFFSWNMGVSPRSGYLSNTAIFHFHDCGRKGNIKWFGMSPQGFFTLFVFCLNMKYETIFDASGEDNKQKLTTDAWHTCPCIYSVLVVEVQGEKDLTYQDSKFHPPASSSHTPRKINMEPDSDSLEDDFPNFQGCILRFHANLRGCNPLHPFELVYLLLVHGEDFPASIASHVSFFPCDNPWIIINPYL